MAKHLVDIDEQALRAARTKLGADTIKDTVNRALRTVAGDYEATVQNSLDRLAAVDLGDRDDAWR